MSPQKKRFVKDKEEQRRKLVKVLACQDAFRANKLTISNNSFERANTQFFTHQQKLLKKEEMKLKQQQLEVMK